MWCVETQAGGQRVHPGREPRPGAQPGAVRETEGLGGTEAGQGEREAGEREEGGPGDCSQLRTRGQWHHSLPGQSGRITSHTKEVEGGCVCHSAWSDFVECRQSN